MAGDKTVGHGHSLALRHTNDAARCIRHGFVEQEKAHRKIEISPSYARCHLLHVLVRQVIFVTTFFRLCNHHPKTPSGPK